MKYVPLSIFALVLLVGGATLCLRIVNLFPLYVDAHTRNTVRTALTQVADREGWLLSNISVRNVTANTVRLIYRDHHRGHDPETCSTLTLADSSLHTCD